jgi:hypothetical protein
MGLVDDIILGWDGMGWDGFMVDPALKHACGWLAACPFGEKTLSARC